MSPARLGTTAPATEDSLDASLSEPRAATIRALESCEGDVLVLGAGGKMGPTLTRMVRRALDATPGGTHRRVVAVLRQVREVGAAPALDGIGIDSVQCDLLDRDAVTALPDAPSVLFLAGQKFGTASAPARTWMVNAVLPALVAERYRHSRIVVFSTGNVYPLVPVASGGAREGSPLGPVGEYAASCLARERVFENAAATWDTRVAVMRLNYAIDLRYGVLTDLALAVQRGDPIALDMGHVNVIWQRDANRAAIELLAHAASPPCVVNVTGPDVLAVRTLAEELGRRLGRAPCFTGEERTDALLSDSARMRALLGPAEMPLETMLDWVCEWVRAGRRVLAKPTHFATRDGAF